MPVSYQVRSLLGTDGGEVSSAAGIGGDYLAHGKWVIDPGSSSSLGPWSIDMLFDQSPFTRPPASGSAASSNGQVVPFAGQVGAWHSITTTSSTFSNSTQSYTLSNLTDGQGNSTSVGFSFNAAGKEHKGGISSTTKFNVSTDYVLIKQDMGVSDIGGKFTGLDNAKTYDMRIFGHAGFEIYDDGTSSEEQSLIYTSFTVNGVVKTTDVSTAYVTFNAQSPTNGELSFTLTYSSTWTTAVAAAIGGVQLKEAVFVPPASDGLMTFESDACVFKETCNFVPPLNVPITLRPAPLGTGNDVNLQFNRAVPLGEGDRRVRMYIDETAPGVTPANTRPPTSQATVAEWHQYILTTDADFLSSKPYWKDRNTRFSEVVELQRKRLHVCTLTNTAATNFTGGATGLYSTADSLPNTQWALFGHNGNGGWETLLGENLLNTAKNELVITETGTYELHFNVYFRTGEFYNPAALFDSLTNAAPGFGGDRGGLYTALNEYFGAASGQDRSTCEARYGPISSWRFDPTLTSWQTGAGNNTGLFIAGGIWGNGQQYGVGMGADPRDAGIANWDTQYVTNMFEAFSGCSALASGDTVTISGAGRADTNGTYVRDYTLDSGIFQQNYTKDAQNVLVFLTNVPEWRLHHPLTAAWYRNTTQTTPNRLPPSTGWVVSSGAAPAPTLTTDSLVNWDVSNVTNFYGMFIETPNFNDPGLATWDTSSSTSMRRMFSRRNVSPPYQASEFNVDISNWNVSGVTDMAAMFLACVAFNQDIGSWNVGEVTDMGNMFRLCITFNQDISSWNVAKVTNMADMFHNCTYFNQDIGSWNVGEVTNMESMFRVNNVFNQNLNSWNVAKVTDMQAMFRSCVAFNGNISSWDVAAVTNMSYMFYNAPFNQDISSWIVAAVTDMQGMFRATPFNQDIGSWNVAAVTNMQEMFRDATAFAQDISSWNVANVTNMSYMFLGCTTFRADISDWAVSNVATWTDMFTSSGFWPAALYYYIVTKWSALNSSFSTTLTGLTTNGTFFDDRFTAVALAPFNTNSRGGFETALQEYSGAGAGQDRGTCEARYGAIGTWAFSPSFTNWGAGWSPFGGPRLASLGADSRDAGIASWDTQYVTTMYDLFNSCASFNVGLNNWNVGSVTDMTGMFAYATSFNQDLSNWNTSSCTLMESMFRGATTFNGNISTWNTGQVTNMKLMFRDCTAFNGDITAWNVSNVTDMRNMFRSCTSFRRDISTWDVSNVTAFNNMFKFTGNWSVPLFANITMSFGTNNSFLPSSAGLEVQVDLTYDSKSWCLVGRGRGTESFQNGAWVTDTEWTWNDNGQNTSQVSTGVGTSAAFEPAFYSSATVNALARPDRERGNALEILLKRASDNTASRYEYATLTYFDGETFAWSSFDSGGGRPVDYKVIDSATTSNNGATSDNQVWSVDFHTTTLPCSGPSLASNFPASINGQVGQWNGVAISASSNSYAISNLLDGGGTSTSVGFSLNAAGQAHVVYNGTSASAQNTETCLSTLRLQESAHTATATIGGKFTGLNDAAKYTLRIFGECTFLAIGQNPARFTVNGVAKDMSAGNNGDSSIPYPSSVDFAYLTPSGGEISFTMSFIASDPSNASTNYAAIAGVQLVKWETTTRDFQIGNGIGRGFTFKRQTPQGFTMGPNGWPYTSSDTSNFHLLRDISGYHVVPYTEVYVRVP